MLQGNWVWKVLIFPGLTCRETCKMKSRMKVGRISVLPKHIIDSILTCLPINEAVRTSILSRSWRYQWHSLSKLTINYNDLLVSPIERVKIINQILLFHCGSVDKFKLDIVDLETHNDIDGWILYLSRNAIKELIIGSWDCKKYNLPSSLFSCSDLKYLKLRRCIFKPPPAAFQTFSYLTELFFVQVVITDKVLENVLNSCPLLSRLSLEQVKPPPSLKINAPKLVMFNILNFNRFPEFMNTPLLDSASFELRYSLTSVNEDCKIVKLLGSMPVLQSLELKCSALQCLAVGDVPSRLPLVCPIRHLKMWINFKDLQEMLAAFCIFRSSPFIQHLKVMVLLDKNRSRNGFWKGEHDFSFKFDHLQTVEVYYLNGSGSELKFIEFLLSNAPSLKTMNISFDSDAENKATTVTKLIRFPRISSKAELILPTYWDQGNHYWDQGN